MSPPQRLCAEFEPQAAVWMAWPHLKLDWPGKMGAVLWVFTEMIRKIAEGERVNILVRDVQQEAQANDMLRAAHANFGHIELMEIPTKRSWTRDIGPMFFKREKGQKVVANTHFNGWAKFRSWQMDRDVASRVAARMGLDLVPLLSESRQVVLEGGGLDVNGKGTLLTTEECYLDQEVQCRNPGFGRTELNKVFQTYFGASNVIWLGKGIVGDEDTHGHVDDVCRFVSPDTVVLVQEGNARDANHRPLCENAERMQGARLEDGEKINVIHLPMPTPLYFKGRRLPASYANFLITNEAVLVPTFNDPQDRKALGILQDCFPTRTVTGIHAVDLVLGLGSVHCLTRDEPT